MNITSPYSHDPNSTQKLHRSLFRRQPRPRCRAQRLAREEASDGNGIRLGDFGAEGPPAGASFRHGGEGSGAEFDLHGGAGIDEVGVGDDADDAAAGFSIGEAVDDGVVGFGVVGGDDHRGGGGRAGHGVGHGDLQGAFDAVGDGDGKCKGRGVACGGGDVGGTELFPGKLQVFDVEIWVGLSRFHGHD